MGDTSVGTKFRERLHVALATNDAIDRLGQLRALAESGPGYVETIQLDRALSGVTPSAIDAHMTRLRVALLSSTTINHLVPAMRVAALRRGFYFDVFSGAFGQYRQELLESATRLQAFTPDVIVLSLSARPLMNAIQIDADFEQVDHVLRTEVSELRGLWQTARQRFSSLVLHQTYLDVFEPLFGSFDRMVPAAPARVIDRLNELLVHAAREEGVALLDAFRASARDGLDAWFDPARWLQAKMEIAPHAAGRYGEMVARIVTAHRGRSRKCIVFDLDNTLWSGVVGDVGVEGLVLGEGSAVGEAHLELQRYAKRLNERGVILAVCSKNDVLIAEHAFKRHPDMLLRRSDIACFVANWKDKAENLRDIANNLNIGLDSLVFVDDNPAERARVRQALPMIAVPELPEDPTHFVRAIADQGYFEAVCFTPEDTQRAASYAANAQREVIRDAAQSMEEFLRGLDMKLVHGPVGTLDLERSTQLINKTNQFNTTGRRYSAEEVASLAADDAIISLQFRLADRLGDSGLVSVMILRPNDTGANELDIDIWVMSCRVFGRQLEDEAMNIAVELARARGIGSLTARVVPTGRNGVVGDLFRNLGFASVTGDDVSGTQVWRLAVSRYITRKTFIGRRSRQ